MSVTRVLLGLGSNLGDRAANLRAALSGLAEISEVEAASPIYETAPLHVTDQPAFLNMAAIIATAQEPAALLAELKALEEAIGRRPGPRFGPRLIDLDILLYGERIIDDPSLQIPHPRMAERAFALAPAADIAGRWRHPVAGLAIVDMLAALGEADGVVRWRGEEG